MPPKRQIIVDHEKLLLRIAAATEAMREETAAMIAAHETTTPGADAEHAKLGWIPYDLETFSGRWDLSPSEKQRWRQALREFEQNEVIVIAGQRATDVRLTDLGWRLVNQLRKSKSEKTTNV